MWLAISNYVYYIALIKKKQSAFPLPLPLPVVGYVVGIVTGALLCSLRAGIERFLLALPSALFHTLPHQAS